ncbi:hypothetical protein HOLDEFILI_04145 [Holdemania filiformis DSM 12042]|uniref:Uncharacterized protein n=1 Tax=Holdemania filiformis DSM 12042 TaxID=545696 RepID=B9YE71_9FIRM|nr:hypothetical protein HOLDEFILI_04145 [Holdemania filiformis DSM 12042]
MSLKCELQQIFEIWFLHDKKDISRDPRFSISCALSAWPSS